MAGFDLGDVIAGAGFIVAELLGATVAAPYAALDLANPKWTDDELIDFMMAHPILINRPIVVSPKGAKLCRPSEAVLDLVTVSDIGQFVKEDGEVVAPKTAGPRGG